MSTGASRASLSCGIYLTEARDEMHGMALVTMGGCLFERAFWNALGGRFDDALTLSRLV